MYKIEYEKNMEVFLTKKEKQTIQEILEDVIKKYPSEKGVGIVSNGFPLDVDFDHENKIATIKKGGA